jgi:hypothetical protein
MHSVCPVVPTVPGSSRVAVVPLTTGVVVVAQPSVRGYVLSSPVVAEPR